MADDLNTVTLSGTLVSRSEMYENEDLRVARLRVAVQGAGEEDGAGTFKVVAFGKLAEDSRDFREGDSLVLSGPLKQRAEGRGQEPVEIHARVLIRMTPELMEHAARE